MAITTLTYNQFDNVPACKAYRSAALTVASTSTSSVIPLDAVEYDTAGMYDAVNDRINITASGVYYVVARATFQSPSTTGHRGSNIHINGVAAYRHPLITPRAGTFMRTYTAAIHEFTAGDYVQLYALQTEGATLDYVVNDIMHTALDVTWLRGPT